MAHQVIFQHERVKGGAPLVVQTGMDEIAWAYTINTAKYPTYGGEVVQILSVFIEDMMISGTIREYKESEEIYSFFMEYFTHATQGANATSTEKYEQSPMIMEYPHRGWVFEIQPIQTPGFEYSLELVSPRWSMQAHVVDKTPDVEKLKEMVAKELVNNENFELKGIISPDSGEPATDPFVAPDTPTGEKFEPIKAKEVTEGLGKIADYYSTLLPAFMKGDFSDIVSGVGAKPIFGRPSESNEKPGELTNGPTVNGKPQPTTN